MREETMATTLTGKEKYRTYTDDIDWKRGTAHDPSRFNVNESERWISAIGGGALAAYGLSRRTCQA
jgi:uncharacterized membrane protein